MNDYQTSPVERSVMDAIVKRLNEGCPLATIREEHPGLLGDFQPGDSLWRDRVDVLPLVCWGWAKATYEASLVRMECGEWFCTGWSGASQAQLQRPFFAQWDEDAGTYVDDAVAAEWGL